MYYTCKTKCTELLADSPWLRNQSLLARLHDALENGREEEANSIKKIMRGVNQRRNWQTIDKEMDKSRITMPTMM